MSSLRLCRLLVHMLSTILILQIVCNAYRPYNDFNNPEEKAISFDYPEGKYFLLFHLVTLQSLLLLISL